MIAPERNVQYGLTARLGDRVDTDWYLFDWAWEVTGGGARRLTEYPSTFPSTIDAAAVMGSIGLILNNAERADLWRYGEITLTDPWGRVVVTMPAKGRAS